MEQEKGEFDDWAIKTMEEVDKALANLNRYGYNVKIKGEKDGNRKRVE